MVKRFKCKTKDCNGQILQATVDKTGGYCMPCVQAKERADREKYIRENRKDVDLYAGVTDNVEIIKIMYQERKYDPLINYLPYKKSAEEIYSVLNKEDEAGLVSYIIDEAKAGNTDFIESIALHLAAFKDADLSTLHQFLIDIHEYYPGILFKHANNKIIKVLFERLKNDKENRNHILSALPWIGHPLVTALYADWITHPPKWSKELYIPVHQYSKEAGWMVDQQGERRNLYYDKCYPLIAREKKNDKESLLTCALSSEHCNWCDRELTHFFEFDLTNPLFDFIPFSGDKLTIASCDACSCYSDAIFMDVNEQGKATWSSYNKVPEYLPDNSDDWDRMPENHLIMLTEPRAVDYAENEFLPTTFSQVGGLPTWIQDTAYPDCPKCHTTMTFIGQISNEDIEEYGEGIYYNYICPDCKITATNYQQT